MTRSISLALFAVTLSIAACTPPFQTDSPLGIISGHVTDMVTSKPVAGATIELEGTNMQTQTAEDGYYEFRLVPLGRHSISVTCPAYEPATIPDVSAHAHRITPEDIPMKHVPTGPKIPKH